MVRGFAAELVFLLAFAALSLIDQRFGGVAIKASLTITAAIALAIQSVTVRRLRVAGVVTTFITGTITTGMVGLVRIIRGQPRQLEDREAEETHVALLFGMLAVYFGAVIFGTYLNPRLPWLVAIAPAGILTAVLAMAHRAARRGVPGSGGQREVETKRVATRSKRQ